MREKKGNCHKIDVVRQMLRSKVPLELPLHKCLSVSEFLPFQRQHESSPSKQSNSHSTAEFNDIKSRRFVEGFAWHA